MPERGPLHRRPRAGAWRTGHPAAGDADRRSGAPGNVEALLGTPADWLLAEAGRQADSDQIIMGGPMMALFCPTPAPASPRPATA